MNIYGSAVWEGSTTMFTFVWETAGFVGAFVYGSFFEWFFHRYWFHTPKFSKYMFREHTLIHHQVYKDGETYRVHPPNEPEKVAMDWWALPALLGFHLPFFLGIQLLTHRPILIGAELAIAFYYGLYESLHWVMHVPDAAAYLSRFSYYRYIDRHHEVHHKYMLSNLNVILPLADYVLGTKRDADGKPVRLFPKFTGRKRTPVSGRPVKDSMNSLLAGKISSEGINNAGSILAAKEDP